MMRLKHGTTQSASIAKYAGKIRGVAIIKAQKFPLFAKGY
jgi:hypothetical protein